MERVTVQYNGENITLEVPDGTSDEQIYSYLGNQQTEQPKQGEQGPVQPKVNLRNADRKTSLELGGASAATSYGVAKAGKSILDRVLPQAVKPTEQAVSHTRGKAALPVLAGSAALGATTDYLNPKQEYNASTPYGAGKGMAQAVFQPGESNWMGIPAAGVNAVSSLGNMVGGITEGVGRYGNMPGVQNVGQGISDFTQGIMDQTNSAHPIMGRVGQYGAYVVPSRAGMSLVGRALGPAATVGSNVARTAAVEGAIGAGTTAGDTETRALSGAFGAAGGAVGAKLAGKGGLNAPVKPVASAELAPSTPQAIKQQAQVVEQQTPNAINSGFADQLKQMGGVADEAAKPKGPRSFSDIHADMTSKAQNGPVALSQEAIDRAAQTQHTNELAAHYKQQGIPVSKADLAAGTQTEFNTFNKARTATANAEKAAKAQAEQAAKAQADAEAKAAFEASQAGQAQLAHTTAIDEAIAKHPMLAEEAGQRAGINYANTREKWIQNPEEFSKRLAIAEERAAKKAATPVEPTTVSSTAPITPKAQEILDLIRARGKTPPATINAEGVAVPAPTVAPTVAPKPLDPRMAEIRARGPVKETPVVKTPSPQLQKTREALAKQPVEETPKGMDALSHLDEVPMEASAITNSVKPKNPSEAFDIKGWVSTTQKNGVRKFTPYVISDIEKQTGIKIDPKELPDISKMTSKEAKVAMAKWYRGKVKGK